MKSTTNNKIARINAFIAIPQPRNNPNGPGVVHGKIYKNEFIPI